MQVAQAAGRSALVHILIDQYGCDPGDAEKVSVLCCHVLSAVSILTSHMWWC